MSRYERFSVELGGQTMAGGIWNRGGRAGTALAIHGISASHLEWPLVARELPELQIIAPDLRGRGHSHAMSEPWSMPDHAEDMAAVLDAFEVQSATVVGHSMGGFVSGWLAARHPERVAALVLVDGGLPLDFTPPADVAPEDIAAHLLGPAGERLTRVYESREQYVDFWRAHPAFGAYWNDAVEAYVDYDLLEVPGGLRPAAQLAAVSTNIVEQDGSGGYREALASLAGPVDFLRAPRGLLDEVPALYPEDLSERFGDLVSGLTVHAVDDVNHYGIVLTPGGAARVAQVVAAAGAAGFGAQPS